MASKKTTKKSTTKKTTTKKTTRKKPAASSRGLEATALTGSPSAEVKRLKTKIEEDGGSALGAYQDPIGGNWQILAGLPVDIVEPTPFQRNLSKAHVSRLGDVIDKLDRFVDPIVTVRTEDGVYWTPNGGHRLAAMKALGSKSIVCLVVPEVEVAYKILALNTEKAHSLGEKCLEVIRMARSLADTDDHVESKHDVVFEDPAFVTLGCCYEKQARFSGSSYTSVLKRLEKFLDLTLPEALRVREKRAAKLLKLDKAVAVCVDELKEEGFIGSSTLKSFVLKEINPLKEAKRNATADFDRTIDKMIEAAEEFEVEEVDTSELPILAE